jgi:hypothetical protein
VLSEGGREEAGCGLGGRNVGHVEEEETDYL